MTAVTTMRHPSKFTDAVLDEALIMLDEVMTEPGSVYDPFAGTGKGVNSNVDMRRHQAKG